MLKRKHPVLSRALLAALGMALLMLSFSGTLAAATIRIVNLNDPGVGFNDTTPWDASLGERGGNWAETYGQARLNAFQYAANLAAQMLDSPQEIRIGAALVPLGGDPFGAVLGFAGPSFVDWNFGGAPRADTAYVTAVADRLSNSDLNPGEPDVIAIFNSEVDGDFVLGSSRWYYGLNGSGSSGDSDFVTVVLHELLHGLGFLSLVDEATGTRFAADDGMGGTVEMDDAYMVYLEDHNNAMTTWDALDDAGRQASAIDPGLHFVGPSVLGSPVLAGLTVGVDAGHAMMYSPPVLEPGSSVSHFDTVLAPNELMEPFYVSANHDPSLAGYLLQDVGWNAPKFGAGDADLSVAITSPQVEALAGALVDYNVTVTNNGNNIATSTTLTAFAPESATQVTVTQPAGSTWFEANNVLTFFLGDLAPSGSVTIGVSAIANHPVTTTMSAAVTSGTNDPNAPANNLAALTLLACGTEPNASCFSSNSGGGCSLNLRAAFDPVLAALGLLSFGYLLMRRRRAPALV
ncbi:MAG: hypothetical protein JSW10_06015 [Pseudomonadota bacterium]|nr:MAG: hypothetical protein JSW10_06015 [Pseudomonadota bacterium]